MRGLIDFGDAVSWCQWPVAESYWVYRGKIQPGPKRIWKWTMDKPLADPNLFKSFANLGARRNLPEAAILRWVHDHGLLWLNDPSTDKLSFDNQKPITPDEFREEASRAYEASTLFKSIYSKDFQALHSRIKRQRRDPLGKPRQGTNADVYLDGQPIPMVSGVDSEMADEYVLLAAKVGLEGSVKMRIRGVGWDFNHHSGHPRPLEVYRPTLVPSIPDLYSAIWFQFGLLMNDARPVKFCEVCDSPIFRPRRNQKVCSGSRCRTEKSRRKKAREGSF